MEGLSRKTGGQVDDIVYALVDAANDKDKDVQKSMVRALLELGRRQPMLVLSVCHSYLLKHQKLVQAHRILLLDTMAHIVKDAAIKNDVDLIKDLIHLASSELTKSKDIEPGWQTAASNVLVSLGTKASNDVMAELLQKLIPGSLPHYFVILTLANLATENVFGVVPFLKDIFSRMLAMLGMAKQDNMRWVFSHCIGRFSEAILDYCANIENAPYPDISKDRFFGEIFSAYEIMFNVWLQSKEAKIRLAVVDALGHMSKLMAKDKLEEQVQRIIQGVTALYKRNTEHYVITQTLCMVIEAATCDGPTVLLPMLDQILIGIHFHACDEPDYNNIQKMKNYNELLRCFQVLTRTFSDRVVSFLLHKIETGNEKSKVATLGIFRHIIYSTDTILNNKREVILSGLTSTLQESSIKIRKAVAQAIIAMAHHKYLDLEGGNRMVEYIVLQCAISEDQIQVSTKRATPDHDKNLVRELRLLCENILHSFTTTIEHMENVLWPFLFETLIPVKYTNGIASICKSLALLATKKRAEDDPDFQIDFVTQVNVPKPHAIIARLMILAGCPHKGGGRGIYILKLMQALSPVLHSNIVDMWEAVLPKLRQYLRENPSDDENWNQKTWEDLILKLLSKTLSEIENEEWNLSFGRVLGQQSALYVGLPEEQSFLFKCLGVVLRKTGTVDFIREHLNLMFTTVDYSNALEREGCAAGIGFCAASHLDQCLLKLEEVTKTRMVRKSTGFMGFTKDKTEADVERIKCTVAVCYGYVVFYGPPGLVVSRLETNVLRILKPFFPTAKDENVKLGLIRAVNLFGKAMQQFHSNADFSFQKRAELLTYMEAYLSKEPKSKVGEVGCRAIEAITSLVKLPPTMEGQSLEDIIRVCADSVYPALASSDKTADSNAPTLNQERLLDSMNEMMKEITGIDCTPARLQTLIQQLERFLLSAHDHERCGVIKTLKQIFDYYLKNVNLTTDSRFSCLGAVLGKLLPRCTDPSSIVRETSVECVQIMLMINDRYEGIPADVSDDRIKSLSLLKDSLENNDASALFNVVNELSMVICSKTPDGQLKSLVYSLLEGLTDHHSQSSNGACASLNCIMKHRGAELGCEISKLIFDMHKKLQLVSFPATVTGSVVAMRTLASHHLILVLTAVLSFQLPFTHITSEFWQTLAKDKDLTQDTLDHILELLNRTAPFSEKDDVRDKLPPVRTATALSLAAICALTEIMKVPETDVLVSNHFSKLFSTIFLYLGSCIGVKPPTSDQKARQKDQEVQPMSYATKCFKHFLERSKCDQLQKYLKDSDCWQLLNDTETFVDGLETVARGLCKTSPKSTNDVVSCLLQALHGTFDTQRIVAAAFFAELINQRCNGDMQLVELLMNSLLSKLVDPSHMVRRLCIKGLGNVASAGGQKLQMYSTTILSAMMAGMDDKEDPENSITLESLSGLSRILSELDESSVRQILINICLRIRPCFEKEKKEVRAAAISLFGNLSRFGTGPSEMSFLEQIHTNFISILLHLNEEPEVAKACKISLRQIGPRLGSTSINEMFQKHLIEGGNLHYGEFINDLSRLIIEDFNDKINFYVMNCVSFLKSSSKDIRANAATLIGFFLGNLPTSSREHVSKEHVCSALIMLLKDNSADVRSRTASAMSLLFEY